MRREQYSGKKQIFTVDGIPVRGLSDADDAIVATMDEETFGQPQVDLYGRNAQHVENSSQTGVISVKLKNSSPDHIRLTALYKASAPISAVASKDIGTNAAGCLGRDCRIKKAPDYQRGKSAQDVVYEFACGELKIAHDGPRIIPI